MEFVGFVVMCVYKKYNIILYILFSLIYLHICTANVKY